MLERYCRQINQTYHRHCANYYNGTVDKLNRHIMDTMFSIRPNCRQIKQNYNKHCATYQRGLVDKSNKPIIDTVLTIKMVW